MRKRDVFGRRINHVSFVIILVVLFIAIIGGRFAMLAVLDNRLAGLEVEQTDLERRIAAIVAATEAETYHEIADIIDELPQAFDQIGVSDDLSIARGIAGIGSSDYLETIEDDAANPFGEALPEGVVAVRIEITMTVDDASKILAYLDAVAGLDRIYHIDELTVDILDEGAYASLTIYTFYDVAGF